MIDKRQQQQWTETGLLVITNRVSGFQKEKRKRCRGGREGSRPGETVEKHGEKHSPLFSSCLVALRARIRSFTSSHVFASESQVLKHLCNKKSQKCELPILVFVNLQGGQNFNFG